MPRLFPVLRRLLDTSLTPVGINLVLTRLQDAQIVAAGHWLWAWFHFRQETLGEIIAWTLAASISTSPSRTMGMTSRTLSLCTSLAVSTIACNSALLSNSQNRHRWCSR